MNKKSLIIVAVLTVCIPTLFSQIIVANAQANHRGPISGPIIPAPTGNPNNLITISGYVFNYANGLVVDEVIGKTIETCQPAGVARPVIEDDGSFIFTVVKGKTFCVRAPLALQAGYAKHSAVSRSLLSTSTSSYENQMAGFDCANADKARSVCRNNDIIRNDRFADEGYTFSYPYSSKDSDEDGFSDAIEKFIGTNPTSACGSNAWAPDVNDDSIVDIKDFSLFKTWFDAYKNTSFYNSRYDLNGDGKVDQADYVFIKNSFSKTCK